LELSFQLAREGDINGGIVLYQKTRNNALDKNTAYKEHGGYSDAQWAFFETFSALAGGLGEGSRGGKSTASVTKNSTSNNTGEAAKTDNKPSNSVKNHNPTSAETDAEAGRSYNHPVKEVKYTVQIPENPAQVRHIFRNADGHIFDTPQNRAMLINLANDKQKVLGNDRHGTT